MKKNRKRISLLITAILCFFVPLKVNASSLTPEPVCVQTVSYNYVTTIDGLLALAERQGMRNRNVLSDEQATIEIEQLISEKRYSDGSIIKEYSKSAIHMMERSIDNDSESKYWGKYDIACATTAFYQDHYGSGEQVGRVLLSTTFTFNDAGTNPVYVSRVDMHSHCVYDPANEPSVEKYATYNNPSAGLIYTLYSGDDRVYGGGGFQQMYCGAIVTLSDGTSSGDNAMLLILR